MNVSLILSEKYIVERGGGGSALPWSSSVPRSGHALASGGVGSPVSRLSNKHAPFTIAGYSLQIS